MTRRPPIGPPKTDTESERLRALLSDPSATPDSRAIARLAAVGKGSERVLRGGNRHTELMGAVTLLPMAQYFGGRHVPVMALAGLGLTAAARAEGASKRLLTSVLEEARRQGFAGACVQPHQQALWREVGFEQAGARYNVAMSTLDVDVADHDLMIRRIQGSDTSAVVACYQRHARPLNGHFVRHPWCWRAIQSPVDASNEVQTYLISGKRGVEGYVYMVQRGDGESTLEVTDMAALTAAAGRRILTMFADNKSLATDVSWHGSPSDGICMLLPERTFSITIANYWFMRIVDVTTALTRRGYPRGVAAELHLEVADPVLPENSGRKVLRVLDGRGTVEEGAGRGTMRITARGLASLFTGHRVPGILRAAGLLDGNDEELALAQTVFGGSDPWHSDLL